MFQHLIRIPTLAAIVLTSVFLKPALAGTLIVDEFVFIGAEVLDDVQVVDGGVPFLIGTTVSGNIQVTEGGSLVASMVSFQGSVKSDKALLIELGDCDIAGHVDLKRTGGEGTVFGILPSIFVYSSNFGKSLKISRSDVNSLGVRDNFICGKLQLARNQSTLAMVVENNVVGNCCD